jgi:DNA-binding MarR family transcriptional regulator
MGFDGDDYVGCLAGHLRAAARMITREYDTALRPHGLRITQVALLVQLARVQPVTVTELALALSGERSAVARDVAILERDGLVLSVAKPGDQRAWHVSLTPAGEQRLSECLPAWRGVQTRMREHLGEKNAAALVALSDRVVSALTPT